MTSTDTSTNTNILPIDIEINIFRNMPSMRQLIKYATTNTYRRNILKSNVKSILLNNKKLQQDDFLTWYKVLTHFDNTINKNTYLLELLQWIKKVVIDKQKKFYKKVYNIVYRLINKPLQELKNVIKQSDKPIRILPDNSPQFNTLMKDFFMIYFLDIDDTLPKSEQVNKYAKIHDAVVNRRPGYPKYIDEHDIMAVFFDFIQPTFVR